MIPETWANVIKVCRVFGTRSWEVAFITRATNDDGEPQLRVTKGKVYNTRGGVKEETDPPLAGGSGCRQQHLRPGGELGPAQAPAHHFREDPRGRPAASALLAAADGRIRGPRRVAPAVLTAGHVLRPGSRDRERRHPDRRGHGAYGGGSSPQLPNFRMAKHSESLREGELMKRLLTLNHVQNL